MPVVEVVWLADIIDICGFLGEPISLRHAGVRGAPDEIVVGNEAEVAVLRQCMSVRERLLVRCSGRNGPAHTDVVNRGVGLVAHAIARSLSDREAVLQAHMVARRPAIP